MQFHLVGETTYACPAVCRSECLPACLSTLYLSDCHNSFTQRMTVAPLLTDSMEIFVWRKIVKSLRHFRVLQVEMVQHDIMLSYLFVYFMFANSDDDTL